MGKVIHFEIAVDNPDRAVSFYQDTFDWKIEKWEGPSEYWLVTTGEKDAPGIDGGMMRRTDPKMTTANTIAVDSVDEAVKKIVANGGVQRSEIMDVPGVGKYAYCEDTEGNPFSVMQPLSEM